MVDVLHAVRSGSDAKLSQTLAKTAREALSALSGLHTRLLGKLEDSEHFNPNESFRELLQVLWILVIDPIIHALGLKVNGNCINCIH
jgi:hypothetical protein